MKAKKDVDSRISRLCQMALTNEDEMEELGSSLLETEYLLEMKCAISGSHLTAHTSC